MRTCESNQRDSRSCTPGRWTIGKQKPNGVEQDVISAIEATHLGLCVGENVLSPTLCTRVREWYTSY